MQGDRVGAGGLYREALEFERQAAYAAREEAAGEPTISVLFRSAASLALDCNDSREAERLVAAALAGDPPDQIANELRDLLEQVYFHRHLSLRGMQLQPSEFQFTLVGKAVGFGIVPSEEFVERVHTVESLLYRTAERQLKRPFRERGRRRRSLQEEIGVYVSVPRAASFAVTFRIGSSPQLMLPNLGFAEGLVSEVLSCFEVLDQGDAGALAHRIGDEAYFRNFIGLAAQIAPDGDAITSVGFTAQTGTESRAVSLRKPGSAITALQPHRVSQTLSQEQVVATGRLEYANKLQDSHEIRLETSTGVLKVQVPPGLMNDIVKPLWDELVTIRGTRRGDIILLETVELAEEDGAT